MRVVEINRMWTEIVGPALAAGSCLIRIDGTIAVICASSPAAAQQLRMKGKKIITLLAGKGDVRVTSMKIYVGSLSSQQSPAQGSMKARKILPDAREVRVIERELSEQDMDPRIAGSLASLMATYRKRFGRKEK